MAKAPSLRKARTRGTQRTRKLSTGKALWSWRNGKERFVRARRETAGAKPYTMKVVRTVFNGGHEETYGNATRLVPTQLESAIAWSHALLLVARTIPFDVCQDVLEDIQPALVQFCERGVDRVDLIVGVMVDIGE